MSKNTITVELSLLDGNYLGRIKKASDAAQGFGGIWGKMAGAGGFIQVKDQVMRVASQMHDLAKEAGRLDSVQNAFRNLAASYGKNGDSIISAMSKTSAGTVSNLDLMESATLAINLMGEQVISDLPRMAEIAKAAAKSAGVDVKTMMGDIVKASGRESVMILDNLGISSKTAAKYQAEFAAKLGLTREKLNDNQQQQAFFYAVMKAGGEVVQRTGGAMLTLGEKMQIVTAQSENTKNAFLTGLTPSLNILVDDLLKASGGWDNFGKSAGRALGLAMEGIVIVYKGLSLTNDAVNLLADAFIRGSFKEPLKSISDNFESLKNSIKNFGTVTEDVLTKAQKKAKDFKLDDTSWIKGVEKYDTMRDYSEKYHSEVMRMSDFNALNDQKNQEQNRQSYEQFINHKLGLDSMYVQGFMSMQSAASVLMGEHNKKLFRIGQAFAIGQSIINTLLAVTKTYSYFGYPWGIGPAAIMAGVGFLQVKKIKEQKPPAYATGIWNVPQTQMAMVHRGEMITHEPLAESIRRGKAALSTPGAAGVMNITNNYIVDGNEFLDLIDRNRAKKARNMGAVDYYHRSAY